jgi:hypothetical protein
LLAQRQVAADEIGAVLGDFNLGMGVFRFHGVEKAVSSFA